MARRYPTGRRLLLLPALGLAACAAEPLDYIPPTDRALLQAQARLGDSNQNRTGDAQSPVSVDDMLRRALAADGAPATARQASISSLIVRFTGETVQLDEAQKQSLAKFAAAAKGQPVSVLSRKGSFDGSAALLGQRRAVAVARALSASLPDVELRFSDTAPPDAVVVGLGATAAGSVTP